YDSRLLSTRPRDGELKLTELSRLSQGIVESARQINTIRAPDVVAVGCTSGAMVMGRERLSEAIGTVYPDAAVTDPLTGVLAALAALRTNRIGFVSPYPPPVPEMMRERVRERGYE